MSNKKTKQPYNMSRAMIILWVFLFFPVAIYFAFRKRNVVKDIDYYIKECNGYMILGVIMILFALPTLTDLSGVSDVAFTLTMDVIMVVSGVVLLVYNFKSKSMYRGFVKYIRILKHDESGTIVNISDAIGKTPQRTLEDLEKMIKKNVLPDTYIDYSMRKIVGPIVGVKVVKRTTKTATLKPEEIHVVACSSCGAKNRVFRMRQTCDYCGSPLE